MKVAQGQRPIDLKPFIGLRQSRLIPTITRSDVNLGVTVTALALPTVSTDIDADPSTVALRPASRP
jgi:hypothetical protein